MKLLFITLAALYAISATAQSPVGSGLSPREVVDHLWKEATEGELLTPDGWGRATRFFVQPSEFPEYGKIRIVSNQWAVDQSSASKDSAEVHVGYTDAGTVDASLRYSPPPRTEFYKTAMEVHLVFAPTRWTMFKSDGKTITGKEERQGPTEWRISDPIGPQWTTVNTAIRYLLEKRANATDPVIKKNADETLARLLKLH